jgi:hypothetical protein
MKSTCFFSLRLVNSLTWASDEGAGIERGPIKYIFLREFQKVQTSHVWLYLAFKGEA